LGVRSDPDELLALLRGGLVDRRAELLVRRDAAAGAPDHLVVDEERRRAGNLQPSRLGGLLLDELGVLARDVADAELRRVGADLPREGLERVGGRSAKLRLVRVQRLAVLPVLALLGDALGGLGGFERVLAEERERTRDEARLASFDVLLD
jgi:hypothetical protein